MRETSLSDSELLALMGRCNNWGRWGSEDELGTLNLITPEKKREAARLVKLGLTVSLSRPLSRERTKETLAPIDYKMLAPPHPEWHSSHDWVGIACHGHAFTHLDALSHGSFDGKIYNGRDLEAATNWRDGLRWSSITVQREGIFTRGVLLDVAGARGVEYLEPGDYVAAADLDAAEKLEGIRVGSGDALLVHIGLRRCEANHGEPLDVGLRAGLHAECLEWLHDRDVATFGADCCEREPYPSSTVPMPLHMIGQVSMGLTLLDWPEVDRLVGVCEERRTYEFLFTCAPLLIPGGTGSAVNPLAIF